MRDNIPLEIVFGCGRKGTMAPRLDFGTLEDSRHSVSSTMTNDQNNQFKSASSLEPSSGHVADKSPRLPERRSFEQDSHQDPKRVYFASGSSEECVLETVHRYPAIEKEEYPLVFWNHHELKKNRQILRKRGKDIVAGDGDMVEAIFFLHEFSSNERPDIHTLLPDERQAIQKVAGSDARGMEHFLTSTMCRYRRWVICMILTLQERSRELGQSNIDAKLSIASEELSYAPCRFAQNVAIGDAMSGV